MRFHVFGAMCFLIALGTVPPAQENSMVYTAAVDSKFVNMPGIPSCLTIAVQHGDPSKGPSTMLLKFAAGCTVPWHWHTAGETLLMVSGHGKAEMKDGKPQDTKPGDYLYLPAKSVHQFTAITRMMLYDIPDGAFDIHYVDADGKEIPPDQALKDVAGAASTKPMDKKPQ